MPLPALHRRNQQAAVKMANTPDLSLRGGRRPTWQSRSTLLDHRKGIGEDATGCRRLPRPRWGLAMTNLGGHCLFNIGPHFPPVRCREGHAAPLQRMTGGLVKFSTFQFHFPRAAPLHMCYPILQKGLLRGSCSRPFAPREGNRQYQRWTTVPASPRTAAPACASEAIMACPPVLANETAALTFGSMEPGAKWPSSQ